MQNNRMSKDVSMDETERIVEERKNEIPVSKVNSIAQGYLRKIERIADEDDEEARHALYELVDEMKSMACCLGDANDIHNFAVSLARCNEYKLACDVLDFGLKSFPNNIDLLADYLQYGMKCNMQTECKKIYRNLLKVPKRRWTWRGFAFQLDYLRSLVQYCDSEKELSSLEEQMISGIEEFKKFFPFHEEAFYAEAAIYNIINCMEKEEVALKNAMENLKVCPKCALRYADMMFERGEYEEAKKAVERGISDATRTQTSVNEGYLYYLSALCIIADASKDKKELSEEVVKEIYSDFNIALKEFGHKSNYEDVIKTKTNMLINKTKIAVDEEEFDLLSELIMY